MDISRPTAQDRSTTDALAATAERSSGAEQMLGIACYHGFGVSHLILKHPDCEYCFNAWATCRGMMKGCVAAMVLPAH